MSHPNQKHQVKRFYKTVGIEKIGEDYHLLLDGRKAKTPAKNALSLTSFEAAELLCAEWDAQKEFIEPSTMHITRMVNASIDHVSEKLNEVSAEIAKYGGSDLMYYRSPEPPKLFSKQIELWDPVLQWASKKFNVEFKCSNAINFVEQSSATLQALEQEVQKFTSPIALSALYTVLTIGGSLIVALAVAHRHCEPQHAYKICELEPDFTSEIWGVDEEAQIRRELREVEFIAASQLLLAVSS